MFHIKPGHELSTIKRLARYYGVAKKSHYEVLHLSKNCTDKEIKSAFVTLSKELHPDKNKSPNAQEMFVEVLEAYNVLGKPNSRAQYDRLIARPRPSKSYTVHRAYEASKPTQAKYSYTFTRSSNNRKRQQRSSFNDNTSIPNNYRFSRFDNEKLRWYTINLNRQQRNRTYQEHSDELKKGKQQKQKNKANSTSSKTDNTGKERGKDKNDRTSRSYSEESFRQQQTNHFYNDYTQYSWQHEESRAKGSRRANSSYYGVDGVAKVPNSVIIIVCFAITLVGTMFQIFVIRELYVVHKRQALERSRQLSEELEKVRAAAQGNTNDMQTQILLDKIVSAAHPSVATASLGKSLVEEQK